MHLNKDVRAEIGLVGDAALTLDGARLLTRHLVVERALLVARTVVGPHF